MNFGSNTNVNYVGAINEPKKVHQVAAHHLETLDGKTEPKIHKVTTNLDRFEDPKKSVSKVNKSLEKLGESKEHIGPKDELK